MTDQRPPRLVLIDSYSLLFRAYFGGRYLSTSDGRPTGALFVFCNMLLSILGQEKPDAVYAAWDAPATTFRKEQFEEYKAHRAPAPDDLRAQFADARRIVEALGIAAVEEPGFEADDLIGTLACEGSQAGYEVVIITGDSDQLQLVKDGVTVRMSGRSISEPTNYDADKVMERYGIPPERIPDYKGLVGDTSDNIPGVPGVGPKTAAKLLQEWGTLDNLLAHVDDLPKSKVKENLAANIEAAKFSRDLATIHCEVPLPGPIRRYEPEKGDYSEARAVFEDLEFRSMIARLPIPAPADAPPAASELAELAVECTVLASESALRAAIADVKAAGAVALRLLADHTQPMRAALQGVAFAAAPDRAYFVHVGGAGEAGGMGDLFGAGATAYHAPLSLLQELFNGEGIERIGHNAKFDILLLRRDGAEVGAFDFDTMLAAYLLNPSRATYALMDLAEEFLGMRSEPANTFSPEEQLAREAATAFALRAPMAERLDTEGLTRILSELELPLEPILADMECVGVPVDRGWLEKLSEEMGRHIEETAARIYELAGEEFTIGSTQQLQRILFEKLQLPTGKKIKTGYSTRADILESLAGEYEIAARILEYREYAKLKSTYADALPKLIHPKTGRIHTSLNQTVAATGRLSSSDPNLQNIPVRSAVGREIRKAFIAPEGQVLLSCDYSQIELRVFAHVTKDPEMLRAFENDEDIHAATATKLFGVDLEHVTSDMRRRAKTVNFAVIYGQSDFGLASTLGIPIEEARTFITNYFAQFPTVKEYTDITLEHAREAGWVQTLLGRRRYMPEIRSGIYNVRQGAERAAVNMPIQGTAADIMKQAMIDVDRDLRGMCYNCTLLLQVHDELVFGIDEALVPQITPRIVKLMEEAFALDVRLRVDAKVGANWAEMRPLAL